MEALSDRGSTPLASTKSQSLAFQGFGILLFSRKEFGQPKAEKIRLCAMHFLLLHSKNAHEIAHETPEDFPGVPVFDFLAAVSLLLNIGAACIHKLLLPPREKLTDLRVNFFPALPSRLCIEDLNFAIHQNASFARDAKYTFVTSDRSWPRSPFL